MTMWRVEVDQEYKELCGKIIRLENFLISYLPSPEEKPRIALMEIQLNVMKTYRDILYLRLEEYGGVIE